MLTARGLLFAVLILTLSLCLISCAGSVSGSPSPFGAAQEPTTLTAPMKVAVLQDQSASRNWTRTPELDSQTMEVLIETVRSRGGEIGFGLIRDDSNRGLLRLRIERPPVAPQPLPTEGNVFEDALRQTRYQERLQGYEQKRQVWQDESEDQIAQFRVQLAPLLDYRRGSLSSDIWGAVRRAALFLEEDDSAWGSAIAKWIVLITDGQDNVGAQPVVIGPGVSTIVVNGSAQLGVFDSLHPLQFESPQAAFEFLAAKQEN